MHTHVHVHYVIWRHSCYMSGMRLDVSSIVEQKGGYITICRFKPQPDLGGPEPRSKELVLVVSLLEPDLLEKSFRNPKKKPPNTLRKSSKR